MPDSLKEQERLIALYHDAVRAYRRATDNLANTHGDEFDSAAKDADRLRLIAEAVRLKIQSLNEKTGIQKL